MEYVKELMGIYEAENKVINFMETKQKPEGMADCRKSHEP